jgi:O-antigen ligase
MPRHAGTSTTRDGTAGPPHRQTMTSTRFSSGASGLLRTTGKAESYGDAPDGLRRQAATTAARSAADTALPVKLISCILVAQLFDYKNLGFPLSKAIFTVTPDRLLFSYLFLAYFFAFMSGRFKRRFTGAGEVRVMCLLGLHCTLSWLIAGPEVGPTGNRWLTSLFNLIYFPLGLYLIVKNTEYKRETVVRLLRVMAVIGIYLGVTGLAEHSGIGMLVWPKYILDPGVGIQFGRVRGPFGSSVAMGEWLIVVFVSASLLMQVSKGVTKALLWLLILVAIVGIYFTDTRGVWLSFAAVVLVSAVFGGRLAKQSLGIVLLVLCGFLFGVGSKFSYGNATLFEKRQETINYRLANYQTAYKMGMANFVTGVGYGNFVNRWREYFGDEERQLISELTDGNHNTYLGLFAETGIIGITLYVSLLVSLMIRCLLIWRRLKPEDTFERSVVVSTLGLVVVITIEGIFGDQRFDPNFNTLLFLFLGIAASMSAKGATGAGVAGSPATAGVAGSGALSAWMPRRVHPGRVAPAPLNGPRIH